MIARLTRRAHRQLAAELDQALADAARHARTARERNTEALAQRARADRLEAQLHLAQQANESLTKELAQARSTVRPLRDAAAAGLLGHHA